MAPTRRCNIVTKDRKAKNMDGKSYKVTVRPEATRNAPKTVSAAASQMREKKAQMARFASRQEPEERELDDEKEYAKELVSKAVNELRTRNRELKPPKELAHLTDPKSYKKLDAAAQPQRGRPVKRDHNGEIKKTRIVNDRTVPDFFERSIISLPKLPCEKDERDMKDYSKKSKAEKKNSYISKAVTVRFNESEVFQGMELMMWKRIAADPVLQANYKLVINANIDKTILWKMARRLFNIFHDTRAERHLKATGKAITAKEKWSGAQGLFNQDIAIYARTVHYMAPLERVRIAHNLTFDKKECLPVFSDIPGEKKPSISDPFFYKYADRNHVHPELSADLTAFTKLAEKNENVIRCNCHSEEIAVPCWQNPECPCYKMNLKLQSLQNADVDHKDFRSGPTHFSTFEPVLLPHKDFFHNTIGFACSELCRCKGCCTNNITMLAEKKVFAFEKFRKDAHMGFSLRTMNVIPAGTPCLEFTGSMMDIDSLDEADQDYAYKVIEADEKLMQTAQHFNEKWTNGYKEKLLNLHKREWYLNPKRYGNMSRTLCHSCEPNTSMIRIYQKSFSPAHIRMFLVTLEDIFPGTELTFDYGPKYEASIGSSASWCRCKKIGCQSSSTFDELCLSSEPTVQAYYALRRANEFRRYENTIVKPLKETSDEYNQLRGNKKRIDRRGQAGQAGSSSN